MTSAPLTISQSQSDTRLATRLASGLEGLEVRQLAAEGYFQAIAYWLNQPLVPQNIYAQVLADTVPGRIKILIEFERSPDPQKLLKFICNRIYQLNSSIIEGIYLIVRAVGSSKTDWEQRIKIPTTNQGISLKKTVNQKAKSQETESQETESQKTESLETQKPNTAPTTHTYESSRSKLARTVVRSQFHFFRAALITGSATAAFLFGGLTELILSQRLSDPAPPEQLPTLATWYDEDPEAITTATEVAFLRQNQGKTVEASFETVAVIPHKDVTRPEDPTISLLFGGEVGLNDFVFEAPESLDQLFAELDIYQQADVAMVGLSEPLATPSTSLQENFYHRTRPQAVKMLKAGGIDIVNLASEGSLLHGSRGLDETLKTLDRQGIYRVGAGRDQLEAHRPEILEVKGQRIAYLGYNPEAIKAAKANKAGVALTKSKERSHITEDIQAIRSQVDWIVVNYRWGDILGQEAANNAIAQANRTNTVSNFAAVPEDWQKSLAREAIDAGADLVVGYHPSQIQGAEVYQNRVIAYSLGDFVFSEAPLQDHDTAALRVSLRNRQMKVEFLPISIRDSKIQMANGEKGTDILQGIRRASNTFEEPLRFPVVLKAPLKAPQTHTSTPSTLPQIPSHVAPYEPLPTTVAPLPVDHQVPAEALIVPSSVPSSEDTFIESAPHPTLREPKALFPVPGT